MDPEAALALAQGAGASYADVRIESTDDQRMRIQDGELKDLVAGRQTGFALRVVVDGAWGGASSTDMHPAAWRDAVESAVALARSVGGGDVQMAETPVTKARVDWAPRIDPRDVDVAEKRALLDDMARAVGERPEVKAVTTSYSDSRIEKHFWNSDGSDVQWSMWRSVAQIHFTARRDGDLAARSARVGGTMGWELFAEQDPVAKAAKAANAAVAQLGAPAAKGGRGTVVIDHELAGVFAHEAVGHASEADLVAIGESCFKGRLGERLGIEGLRIHDDSLLPGAFGSIPFDDDGVPGQDKPILDDGVLVGLLADRERGAALGVDPNGASRAQDITGRPLVRMSNTLIDAGDHGRDEVFDIKDGIYCQGSRGGQVDTARGTFLFNAQDAWKIENGQITTPLRDVSLTGGILSTLHNIDALGDERRLGDPGYCGKGQWVPVCDGGPLVRIRDCLVGGAA